MGQAGVYIVHDPAEDSLGLPSGYGQYDVPLVLTSKQYNEDGTLISIIDEDESVWGDVIQVVGASRQRLKVPSPPSTRMDALTAAERATVALLQRGATQVPLPILEFRRLEVLCTLLLARWEQYSVALSGHRVRLGPSFRARLIFLPGRSSWPPSQHSQLTETPTPLIVHINGREVRDSFRLLRLRRHDR